MIIWVIVVGKTLLILFSFDGSSLRVFKRKTTQTISYSTTHKNGYNNNVFLLLCIKIIYVVDRP